MRRVAALLAIFCLVQTVDARQPVRAKHGMVVSRESNATDVGVAILDSGGNAVDAAAAVAFALAVTYPFAGNIGGGGFMLVQMADGRTDFIDFRERAPKAASHDMYLDPTTGNPTKDSTDGYRASGVPGTVRGMEMAMQKFGKKTWKDVLDPAIKLAREGYPVSYSFAESLVGRAIAADSGPTHKMSRYPESNRVFLHDGNPPRFGDTFKQPDLANTLVRIRDKGAKEFYEGETAKLIADDMMANGGLITMEDLRDYKAIERKPLTGKYRGYDILTSPPPSSGGVGILQMLGVLEGTDFTKEGFGSAYSLHWEAEAMRRYYADRSEYMGDPDFVKVPMIGLVHPDYIKKLRESIDPTKATPSSEVKPGNVAPYESAETTHFSVVDADGNAVSVTYTLNGGYGSGVTIKGAGIVMNNEMDDFTAKPGVPNMFKLIQGEANSIAPGKTPLSSMTPTIVSKDGKPYVVLGTPGGSTIITAVLQTIINIVDFGMNAQEAVDAPRIHHQWQPDVLNVEKEISPDTIALLKQRGHTVRIVGPANQVNLIRISNGWVEGAADGRVDGTAKGQ